MAKTETTVKGYVYTVTSPNGGTVTDADGKLNKTVDPGDQVTVTAPSDSLTCDDDDAVICKANFKNALAALRLLGGGDNLPTEYTRVEYLEADARAYINSKILPNDDTEIRAVLYFTPNVYAETHTVANEDSTIGLKIASASYIRWGSKKNKQIGNVYKPRVKGELVFRRGYVSFDDKQVTFECDSFEENPAKYSILINARCYELQASLDSKNRWYNCQISEKGIQKRSYIPVIDLSGAPCMYDLVSKAVFKNIGSGQFVAGVKNAAQLRAVLRKLPDLTGQNMGTLTLSIPSEANTPEMQELLDTTETQKNWELTMQERAAAAVTYSLRRVRKVVWVRREPDKNGSYVDAAGERWLTEWCSAIYSPRGNDPTLHGYEPFDSVEQAVEVWGLTPYEYPAAMGDNGTLERGGTENTSPKINA